MKTKIILEGIVILFLTLQIVSATSIDIDVNPIFNTGETVSFAYTISSESEKNIEYSAYVTCPNAPQALLQIKNALLNPSAPLTENYTYMSSVSESIETQECKAVVWIETPEQIFKEEYFTIQTNPAFEFEILSCKDSSCNEQKKVFVKNDDVYLKYNSSVGELEVNAVVTFPDGTNKQFNLPSSFNAEQVGSYSLEITASKLGYDTIIRHLNLGVISEEADIGYTSLSEIEKESNNLIIIVIILALIILIVGILAYFIFLKKNLHK